MKTIYMSHTVLTRVIDWRVGAGTEVTRPAIAYTAHSIALSFDLVVFYFKANHTANEKSNSENSWEELCKDHL